MTDVRVEKVGAASLGQCPAAVVVGADGDTVFVVNADVFPTLGEGEQYFILAHELGHRLLGTSSEEEADAFALGLTAGRRRRSLKDAVRAVAAMRAVPAARVEALYCLCRRIDKNHNKI